MITVELTIEAKPERKRLPQAKRREELCVES